MQEKADQPVWDPREPREREMLWIPHSRKASRCFSSVWTREHPAGKRISLVPVLVFTAVSWTYAPCPMSPTVLAPALAARWKRRVNFANVKRLSEGFSGVSCSCFFSAGGTARSSEAARKVLLSIWKCAFVQSSVFAISTCARRELPSGTRL